MRIDHYIAEKLRKAKWRKGLIWGVVMFCIYVVYKLYVLEIEPDENFWGRNIFLWTLFGLAVAIMKPIGEIRK